MKKAKIKDLKKVYGIILECAKWLKSKGIKQWDPPYPRERFKQDINDGKLYYFTSDNKIIGTATLSTKKLFYYPKNFWKSSSKVWYLTKFAVPRKLENLKIGKKILKKIDEEAKKRKIKKIRIDIPEYNKKLKLYYSLSGFVPVRKSIFNKYIFILMEKIIK